LPSIRLLAVALIGAGLLISATAQAQLAVFPPDKNGQVIFVMPSRNVECTYTPAGGTPVYKPADGGPELSCDRRDPRYVRIVLTAKSIKRFDDVGDQGCCGADNPFPYGMRWSRGPFTCESLESGLVCRNAEGRGFTVSRQKIELF
jgi:hypothetical protein